MGTPANRWMGDPAALRCRDEDHVLKLCPVKRRVNVLRNNDVPISERLPNALVDDLGRLNPESDMYCDP